VSPFEEAERQLLLHLGNGDLTEAEGAVNSYCTLARTCLECGSETGEEHSDVALRVLRTIDWALGVVSERRRQYGEEAARISQAADYLFADTSPAAHVNTDF
jgi:hypothetical protein